MTCLHLTNHVIHIRCLANHILNMATFPVSLDSV